MIIYAWRCSACKTINLLDESAHVSETKYGGAHWHLGCPLDRNGVVAKWEPFAQWAAEVIT